MDREMGANQYHMSFLDDIFQVTMPREVGEAYEVQKEVGKGTLATLSATRGSAGRAMTDA